MTVYVLRVVVHVLLAGHAGAPRRSPSTTCPIGGAWPSGMLTSASAPGFVWSTVFVTLIGLPVCGRTRTRTRTSVSSFSPWLANRTVNARSALAGMRFVAGCGCRVVSPTDTLIRPWPWRPGASCWFDVPPPPAGRAERGRRRCPGCSQVRSSMNRAADDALPADLVVVERLVDERDDALEVDDVGREERLHLAGDLVDRLLRRALLVAARPRRCATRSSRPRPRGGRA